MRDYYSLLGVEPNATKTEIKKNYRLLAAKYHPDKSKDPSTVDKFIAITEAYDVLSNKKLRVKYDLIRWEQLKRKKESADTYNIVVPPFESARTRRNKSQKKRSITYHNANTENEKRFQLLIESFYVVSRYVFHLLGFTIFSVILISVIGHLADAFEKNMLRGIIIGRLGLGIVYVLFWILQNAFLEVKKDLEVFSAFYKITQNKATNLLLLTAGCILLLYVGLLKWFF